MTIPTIASNIQQAILKNQFKKFYSTFKSAVMGIQTREGRPIKCFYWIERPSSLCTEDCSQRNEHGSCIAWVCAETGDALPPNTNGEMGDCIWFQNELFLNTLKTTKICKDYAYDNGCLPKDFRGVDKVKKEQNPDKEYDPTIIFADNPVKNNNPVYVLSDGTYIIGYYRYLKGGPIWAVDINGHKGPNKWGFDIFSFQLQGTLENGITTFSPVSYSAVEAGGKTFQQMLKDVGLK